MQAIEKSTIEMDSRSHSHVSVMDSWNGYMCTGGSSHFMVDHPLSWAVAWPLTGLPSRSNGRSVWLQIVCWTGCRVLPPSPPPSSGGIIKEQTTPWCACCFHLLLTTRHPFLSHTLWLNECSRDRSVSLVGEGRLAGVAARWGAGVCRS